MRIESQLGCPASAGDPAEEKTVPDGSTGLFTNILDCFRVLISGLSSEDTATREGPVASGKSVDPGLIGPTDVASWPTTREEAAALRNGVCVDDPTPRQDVRESSEACASPNLMTSAAATFSLAIPDSIENGQAAPGTSDTAARQAGGRGREVFAGTAGLMPAGLQQQAEIPGFEMSPQSGVPFGVTASRHTDTENGGRSTVSARGPSDPGFNSASVDQDEETENPQVSTMAESRTVRPTVTQAAAPVPVIDAHFLQLQNPSTSDGTPPVPASVSAQSAPAILLNGKTEPKADFPVASETTWLPQRSVRTTRANMSQPDGRTLRSAAAPQPAAPPEERFAYTRISGLTDGAGSTVDANVEDHHTGPYAPAQKSTDKVLSSTPGQQADGQEGGNRADSRPGATDTRPEVHLQAQAESAMRPAGPLKTTTAIDPATTAVESESVSAGRGRLRTTFEGGAREGSASPSLSAMARDAQIPPQATSGVKDVKAPEFVFEVAERISTVVTGGRGEVTIQLKPDQFGRMNIVAESGPSGILARITTESASLKQYLESNLPLLQQALQDQGLKVERIDVLVQEGLSQQQSANQWQHNFGHAPGGHDSERMPRFAPVAAAQPGEPANEITLDAIILSALHPNSTFHTIA